MDKNELLIQLSETGCFGRVSFEEMSPAEQVFCAIWELESQVTNGGFHQYFANRSGDTAYAAAASLRTIGAHAAASMVEKANSIFPSSAPPVDETERCAILESLEPHQTALLEELDEAFLGYPDNLTELLFAYVKANAKGIDGAVQLGIC